MTSKESPASPFSFNRDGMQINHLGLTKEEVVMKDFMAAIINAFSGTKKGANALLEMRGKHNIEPDIIVAKMAKEYTAAYFKELNKKDNGTDNDN